MGEGKPSPEHFHAGIRLLASRTMRKTFLWLGNNTESVSKQT